MLVFILLTEKWFDSLRSFELNKRNFVHLFSLQQTYIPFLSYFFFLAFCFSSPSSCLFFFYFWFRFSLFFFVLIFDINWRYEKRDKDELRVKNFFVLLKLDYTKSSTWFHLVNCFPFQTLKFNSINIFRLFFSAFPPSLSHDFRRKWYFLLKKNGKFNRAKRLNVVLFMFLQFKHSQIFKNHESVNLFNTFFLLLFLYFEKRSLHNLFC